MKYFRITGILKNGFGETVSLTIQHKKSLDIFYVNKEQAEDLINIVQRHLTPVEADAECRCSCDSIEIIRTYDGQVCAECGKLRTA